MSIDRPSHGAVGLERISLWHYGEPAAQLPPLAIHALDGELSLALDGTKETLAGPGTLVADSGGRFQPRTKKDLPTWMTEAEPSLKDRKLGEQFLEQFSKDRPVLDRHRTGHRERIARHQEAGDLRGQGDGRSLLSDSHPDPRGDRQRPPEHSRGAADLLVQGPLGR